MAAVPPLAVALWMVYWGWWTSDRPELFGRMWQAMTLYALFAAGFLALAALVPGGGWGRRTAFLLALAIPAPLMVYMIQDHLSWLLYYT